MLDSEGQRRADVVWNRLSYLGDVINIAPMLGLLGTVVGMMQAFFALQYQSISASSGALTRSIGGAMATTFFGLIVAIVSLVFYSIAKARLTRTLAEVEQTVHSIADHIKRGIA
jgi:biopolymer transport protein ExbB